MTPQILTRYRLVASLAPNSTLISSEAKEAAIVDQWVAFTDASIASPTSFILKLVKGAITPYNKPVRLLSKSGSAVTANDLIEIADPYPDVESEPEACPVEDHAADPTEIDPEPEPEPEPEPDPDKLTDPVPLTALTLPL